MSDRKRINGPAGGTQPSIFVMPLISGNSLESERPRRIRTNTELRKIFLKTGLTPSASGSAYLELGQSPPQDTVDRVLIPPSSALKLTCTVHGPQPLSRSAPFSPNIALSTHVKFAPFAARERRGYLRDSSERDLAVHLETALRGVIIAERWPKSGLDVVVTVLEGEEGRLREDEAGKSDNHTPSGNDPSGLHSILSGCIIVASAAIFDAGVDCVDLVSGGVASIVRQPLNGSNGTQDEFQIVLDPSPSEHQDIIASCVVSYLKSHDELTELWVKGSVPHSAHASLGDQQTAMTALIDGAIRAATAARIVLLEATKDSLEKNFQHRNPMLWV